MTHNHQPERIQGAAYTVRSDVWSLGITLIELCLGRFPFAPDLDSDSDSDGPPSEDEPTLSPVRTLTSRSKTLAAAEQRHVERRQAKESTKKSRKSKSKGVSLGGRWGRHVDLGTITTRRQRTGPPCRLPEGRFPIEVDSFINTCV